MSMFSNFQKNVAKRCACRWSKQTNIKATRFDRILLASCFIPLAARQLYVKLLLDVRARVITVKDAELHQLQLYCGPMGTTRLLGVVFNTSLLQDVSRQVVHDVL